MSSSVVQGGFFAQENLVFHAILSAYLSIFIGLTEAGLSVYAGHAEISMALYGIAVMGLVDGTGSVLVLMMWQCGSQKNGKTERLVSERIREMRYSLIIGCMMLLLGSFLVVDSLKKMVEKESPSDKDLMGFLLGVYGSVFGFFLASYKYIVGKALDSPVIIADSISSLCAAITSFAALVVTLVDNKLWWSDSAAGFTAALYMLYSGASTVLSANVSLQSSLSMRVEVL